MDLMHSYKGTRWKKHIYTLKKGNSYVYPEDYRRNLLKRKTVDTRTRYSGHTSKLQNYNNLSAEQKMVYRSISKMRQNEASKRAVKGSTPSLKNAAQKGYNQAQNAYNEKKAVKNAISAVATIPLSKALSTAKDTATAALGVKSVSKAASGARAISNVLKSIGSKIIKKK